MSTRTVILGGGFGGLAAATELRRRLGPEHEVVLVDRREGFMMGLRKLWVLVGASTTAEGTRPRARIADRGVRWVQADVLAIDAAGRRVETTGGSFEADFLIVALGAEPRGDLVPGLGQTEHAFNLYDPASVERAALALRAFEAGQVVVAIAGVPYKCPPAPYEAVMLLHDHFQRRGVRQRIGLTFTTVQPALLPNAGPEGGRWVAAQLEDRAIRHHTGRRVERVEPHRIVYAGGVEMAFQLALVVPPHAAPAAVRESALAGEAGWVTVDRTTLHTPFERVWAIGDVAHIPLAGGGALPRAGIFAEAEGRHVARTIAAEVLGTQLPPAFDGHGACWMEVGADQAALVEGTFYAEGGPSVRIRDPSGEHLAAKQRFERELLQAWLPE